ncbi:MAG: hypothetical protein MJY45_03185 [Bacteroidales bacterium]|nr:hypothetical protein [Bacteroidales bacterium]
MTKYRIIRALLQSVCLIAAAAGFHSCISVDGTLGEDFVPEDELLSIYVSDDIPIDEISLRLADSLSGYSSKHITFGSTKDELFGVCNRGCALTLIPLKDSVDFGKDPVFKKFTFKSTKDTISYADDSQKNILQNVFVYELSHSIDSTTYDINRFPDVDRSRRVSRSIPVVGGNTDTLKFDFTKEFGEKYLSTLASMKDEDWSDIDKYLEKLPGIFIETDEAEDNGGRINMFNLQLGFNASQGIINNDYAQLDFTAEFDGRMVDTTCLFYFSPDRFYNIDSLLYYSSSGTLPQYCLNVASHSSVSMQGPAEEKIYMEGAGGISPVIKAEVLKSLMEQEISKHGDPKKALINKATLVFSYDASDDFEELKNFPDIINPSVRVKNKSGTYSFSSLTGTASISRPMGAIDRSNMVYSPDISYHAQEILSLNEENDDFSNYDVWFLIMHADIDVASQSASEAAEQEYYNQLMYANYYNNLYSGYYNNSYNNYYNYMMYSNMYSSSSSSTYVSINLDKERYYKAVLNGPEAAEESKRPRLRFVYSLPNR